MKMMIKTSQLATSAALALSSSLFALPAHSALQGRSLDSDASTFEAYYDTTLNVTWVQDANLFKTQYTANNGVIQQILAGTPTINEPDLGGDYTLSESDFTNPTSGTPVVDGAVTWYGAQAWINHLNTQRYGGSSNWRLPTVSPQNGTAFDTNEAFDGSTDYGYRITSPNSELSHLYYVTLGNGAGVDLQGNDIPGYTGLTNAGPFANLQNSIYWYGSLKACQLGPS